LERGCSRGLALAAKRRRIGAQTGSQMTRMVCRR
jgi:hypothetical protein